ncbi:hypothetical protein [Agrobacterium genomosp. 13]|uniref:Uncharacterized protein n=1 Tax=Agrobacterium genomosp. 13 str. CFBP 6927 TaxID=1183428 RepID=A0ABM9VCS7_9HYPH|nr:hypothetical protein [Agrobacterium genomosp. 13]CUX18221.1 exported hypothetical protein [Agrobacterium genomosp. 13 str. CFBP 6927]
MQRHRVTSSAKLFAVLGAALSVSAAVRAHRKPARADLEALGIDGKAFDKVQL